jgi:hypothetical protein
MNKKVLYKRAYELLLEKNATRTMDMIRGGTLSPQSLLRLGFSPPSSNLISTQTAGRGVSGLLGGLANAFRSKTPAKLQTLGNSAASKLDALATKIPNNPVDYKDSSQYQAVLNSSKGPQKNEKNYFVDNEFVPAHQAVSDIRTKWPSEKVKMEQQAQHLGNVMSGETAELKEALNPPPGLNQFTGKPRPAVKNKFKTKQIGEPVENFKLPALGSLGHGGRPWGSEADSIFKDSPVFAMRPSSNAVAIPNIRAVKKVITHLPQDEQKSIIDQLLSSVSHEVGHQKHISRYSPEQIKSMMALLHRKLGPTYKEPFRKYNPGFTRGMFGGADELHNGMETIGHFLGTRGGSRAAKAAISVPIEKMRVVNPALLAEWQNSLINIPENLRNRLLATRSHTYLNYGMK